MYSEKKSKKILGQFQVKPFIQMSLLFYTYICA